MRALARRLARLEAVSRVVTDALVGSVELQRMAAIVLNDPLDQKLKAVAERVLAPSYADQEALCAQVREKLMSGGPYPPAADRSSGDPAIRAKLREKLLGPDAPAAAEPARP